MSENLELYQNSEMLQHIVTEIKSTRVVAVLLPWMHNVLIIEKVESHEEATY